MKSVLNVAAELLKSRAANSSAAARRLGGEMCKELKTKVLRLSPATPNGPSVHQESHTGGAEILRCTVKALKEGDLVAVPTDTIYGLACLAQNSEAVRKTYDVKGRDAQKPLAICVGEIQDIYKYCKVPVKEALLGDLLPGPVTLVFERSEALNADLNPFTSVSPLPEWISPSTTVLPVAHVPVCSSACRRTHPRPCLYETPLPDVWGTARTHQRQHQLTHQHRGRARVSGALAQTCSGGGWRTNRRPEPPRINGGRPISAGQISHHQTRLCPFLHG
ncbi:threonylcarbamoyl-AMP synthase isoform X1 [Chaetodon auriga]|uniref:threonylcarbamoyl-AMP synthase isoform X1 n=1 Tax=Chaetodon auriga TaxID=39042 RepID=UPI004032CA9F